jgi:hypothetical protein
MISNTWKTKWANFNRKSAWQRKFWRTWGKLSARRAIFLDGSVPALVAVGGGEHFRVLAQAALSGGFRFILSQVFQIGQVLMPTGGLLVGFEVLQIDKIDRRAVDIDNDALIPAKSLV